MKTAYLVSADSIVGATCFISWSDLTRSSWKDSLNSVEVVAIVACTNNIINDCVIEFCQWPLATGHHYSLQICGCHGNNSKSPAIITAIEYKNILYTQQYVQDVP